MYSQANGQLQIDASQDYDLLSATSNGTHFWCSFNRSVDTCDSKEDLPVTVRSFAYSFLWRGQRHYRKLLWVSF
jgi:hypothetical protein